MKTYEQAVNKAARIGLISLYSGGSSEYAGAHTFVEAVEFIYGVSRDTFIDDVERLMNEARETNKTSDDAIAWLEKARKGIIDDAYLLHSDWSARCR